MSQSAVDLSALNPNQVRAVTYTGGPLLVSAGCGSGKTRVITYRVAHLIDQGVNPGCILIVTFTNKAAAELKERLKLLIPGPAGEQVWAGTLHSFGAWFLRREAHNLGYKRTFSIYDEREQRTVLSQCINAFDLKNTRGLSASLSWVINMSKDTGRPYYEFEVQCPVDPGPIIDLYEEHKRVNLAFDFADLIKIPGDLLAENPQVGETYRGLFSHILIDEFQDINTSQFRLICGLVGGQRNICAVGDIDQAIYSWRGASVDSFLQFKDRFPGTRIISLDINYRSCEGVLKAAANLIQHNIYRIPKILRPERSGGEGGVIVKAFPEDHDEIAWVSSKIYELIRGGVRPSAIAVFYRVNALSRLLEEYLGRRGIPYTVSGGVRFYNRREIKDVIAYLRLLHNPSDEEALARAINTPSRGVGHASIEKLQSYARRRGLHTMSILEDAWRLRLLKNPASIGVSLFIGLFKQLVKAKHQSDIATLMDTILVESGMEAALEREIDGEDRLLNVRELIAGAEGVKDLSAYLVEKEIIAREDTSDGDKVSVLTIHSAKGLEFDHVFIIGLEEGLLPHGKTVYDPMELEEERRLLYVGITRARKYAWLTRSERRYLYGTEMHQRPSGFLRELGISPC